MTSATTMQFLCLFLCLCSLPAAQGWSISRIRTVVRPRTSKTRRSAGPWSEWGVSLRPVNGGTSPGLLERPIVAIKKSLREKEHDNVKLFREHLFVFLAGLCLSFNAGYINGCCLSGLLNAGSSPGVGVAAFTGTYTQAGLALGAGDLARFASHIRMILCFIGGSCISGLMNPRPTPYRITPRYGPIFLVGSVLLTISATLAHVRPESHVFLYFAAAANGLQNAMSSMYSANLIRSSHLSGITSDIGLFLGQILRGNFANAWRLVIISGLSLSFVYGGAVAYLAMKVLRTRSLMVNALLFFAVGASSIAYTSYVRRVSLWRAASGRWVYVNDRPSELYLMNILKCYEDKTGHVTYSQFVKVMKKAGIEMSSFGMQEVFADKDKDADGHLSRAEMLSLINCDPQGECSVDYDE